MFNAARLSIEIDYDKPSLFRPFIVSYAFALLTVTAARRLRRASRTTAPVVEQLDDRHRSHHRATRPTDRAVPRELPQGLDRSTSHSSVPSRPTRWAAASCTCGWRCRRGYGLAASNPWSRRTARRSLSAAGPRTRISPACATSPYKIPTPWIAMYYLPRRSTPRSRRLGEARSLRIQVTEATKDGLAQDRIPAAQLDGRSAPAGVRRAPKVRMGSDPMLPNYPRVRRAASTTCVPARRSERSVSGLYWRSSQIGRLLNRCVMVHNESPRRTM